MKPLIVTGDSRLRRAARGTVVMTAALAAIASVQMSVGIPEGHASPYCELGNLLIPQEVHHVGTYRDATCAMVADLVLTAGGSSCVRAVSDYVVGRGYDPYVAKDIALHNC